MSHKETILKILKDGGKTTQQIFVAANQKIPRESLRRDLSELRKKGLVQKVMDKDNFVFSLVKNNG